MLVTAYIEHKAQQKLCCEEIKYLFTCLQNNAILLNS